MNQNQNSLPIDEWITFKNKGHAISETNYWNSDRANAGLLFLSWNSGAGRVLLPDCQKNLLKEMKSASYVIVSRGPWYMQGGRDAIELLFEDHTNRPFCIHLSIEQCDRVLSSSDLEKSFCITVWTRGGEKLRLPGKYREVDCIPCLDEWIPRRGTQNDVSHGKPEANQDYTNRIIKCVSVASKSSCKNDEHAEIVNPVVSSWTFGELSITNGAVAILSKGIEIETMLSKIIAGDYGTISHYPRDQEITSNARKEGRPFCAIFETPFGVLYFSMNENGRTIVCKMSER